MQGLKVGKRGRPAGKAGISPSVAKKICKMIIKGTPDVYGIPYFLWTTDGVRLLIKKIAGVDYTRRHVGRFLDQWGFTCQKPVYKAYEQDAGKVKVWLEDEYKRIAAKAKRQKAIIYWEDETGMRSDHQAGKTFSPKGQTPVIRRTGQRFSVNMVAAISNRGYLQFMLLEGKFNGEVFIKFLNQLVKGHRQKVFLIVDGHPAHKTKKVQQWVYERRQFIELFFLPPYSPELNPTEYFNQDIKTNAIGKTRPKNKEELKMIAKSFAKRKKKDPEAVRKYFHARHVKYAA
jgi:transposase